ncbi:D-TA family PLP-dependent enzyme [Chthonobacter rhizosphaerae]|uniref:D-TA family PLP-dependent enzyme n=1 Tax=Chthonobacter rhizosphaerae TaxID=2735553 RepID=UPI0015EF9089|nr:D-TA family PLP-dependent enzyme [Chthonobacter rhizosphaerae]
MHPRTLAEIDTPAVVIDVDRAMANIARAQAYGNAHGLPLRPHIKTHKLPFFAHAQMERGAIGITVQKIGEAEVMADAGLTDIFLPYNIVGADKLKRLRALADRVALSVTADGAATVAGLSAAFADAGRPLSVLVECDTGMGRCGVQTPDEARALAEAIDAADGLAFGGLMAYPAVGKPHETQAFFAETLAELARAGLEANVVSNGGTPDLWRAHEVTAATEHRPGTYIYLDRYQVARGVGTEADCALTVLTTVVSRPTSTRAIVDAGSKALTSDTLGMTGFGAVVEVPGVTVSALSEEHGFLDLSAAPNGLAVGDRVRILPNHACVVSNLFDVVHLVSGDRVVDVLPVAARGRVG